MNYLTLENISKSYGEKTLFEGINLQINQGEKIALVAKNGAGKTTLLKIIAGVEAAEGETHRIILRRNIRVGWLPQEPEFKAGQSVLEAVFDSENPKIKAVQAYEEAMLLKRDEDINNAIVKMEELKAWDIEAKVKEILFKFNIKDLQRPIDVLSGGQKKRIALAKVLIEEPEFLILDEPTNHLDIEMIEWLETYLQNPNRTLFMVTHDRYFLNRVCNTIIELDGGEVHKYNGNYEDFIIKRSARLENQAANLERTQKLFKRELEWMRRQPQARTTKAKSRIDDFYEIKEKAHQKIEETEIKIDLKGARLGSKIVEFHYISKSYGDLQIVKDFDYKFRKNERVGIVGPNGVGKTTFLQLLTKEIRPDSGKVVIGGTVQFGYYTQEGISLAEDKRVIDVITDIAEYIPLEKGQKMTAATLLERFLFSRKQQQHYISTLSGGERRRLHLLTVIMQNPNFLILDEPTNDLDIITLNILEDFLLQFPGCVVIVTHDRYFMNKLVEHLFVFEGEGKIRDFNGDYDDYRAMQKAKLQAERAAKTSDEPKAKKPKSKDTSNNLSYEERKELKRVERKMEKLEEQKAKISEQFSDASLTPEQITDLSKQIGAINDELEEVEMRWMELAEKS